MKDFIRIITHKNVILCNQCESIKGDYDIVFIQAMSQGDIIYSDMCYIILDKDVDLSHAGFYIEGSLSEGMSLHSEHTEPVEIEQLSVQCKTWDEPLWFYVTKISENIDAI